MPSLALSYALYGNIDHSDEIVARNKVQHPGFVPGGIQLEVLAND